ncbi:MAG: right-handed parallel beta-helix repeat-containing protein [Bacteroidales bacterium]|nr:right-handed parallel beta-helix repeat-containing protein [Bacteroidales bacterium]
MLLFSSISSYAQYIEVVNGIYPGDYHIWDADTVKVTGDVVMNGRLTISPGTYIKFMGNFGLSTDKLIALGTKQDSIVFSVHDTTGNSNLENGVGGWKGLLVKENLKMQYNKIEYVKNLFNRADYHNLTSPDSTASDYSFEIRNSVFKHNYVKYDQGLIFPSVPCYVDIDSNTFENNNSVIIYLLNNSGFWGPGIRNNIIMNNKGSAINIDSEKKIPPIIGNTIFNNADWGIYVKAWTGDAKICNNHIYNNLGGICLSGFDCTGAQQEIMNNIILNNNEFGGISISNCTTKIINNLIVNNTSTVENGGGVKMMNAFGLLLNNTISDNSATLGGGIFMFLSRTKMYNCILRNNVSETGKQLAAWDSNQNNIGFDGDIYNCNLEGVIKDDLFGDYINNIDEDPSFTDPVNNDFHLNTNSPCINSGTVNTYGLLLPSYDLEGNPRVFGASIDMGAYEFQGSPFNNPPVLLAPDTIILFLNTPYTGAIDFIEADNDNVYCTITSEASELIIDNIIIDNSRIHFDLVTDNNWIGQTKILLRIEDEHGAFETDTIIIIVKTTNAISGELTGDIHWCADTVKVTGNVTVQGKLTICSGTYVEFQGNYEIMSDTLIAVGVPGDSIVFSIYDTTGFSDFETEVGGWKGIRVEKSMMMHYCKLEFVKNLTQSIDDIWNQRTMISIAGGSEVNIKYSSFRYNYAKYASGLIMNAPYSYLDITDNIFEYNYRTPIYVHSDKGPGIHYNKIRNNKGDGIRVYGYENVIPITFNTVCFNEGWGIQDYASFGVQTAIVMNNVVTDNYGGIAVASAKKIYVCNNIILRNSPYGGLAIVGEDSITSVNNLICYNNGIDEGAGVMIGPSRSVNLINNTICNNSSSYGSDVFYVEVEKLILVNCILRNNNNETKKQLFARNTDSNEIDFHADIYNSNIEGITSEDVDGLFIDNIDEDALFIDAHSFDFHLGEGSPCINTGIQDTTGLHLPATDLDGNLRITDLYIDMGVYEYYTDVFYIITQPEGFIANVGENRHLKTSSNGGIIGYQWQKNGVDLLKETNNILRFNSLRFSDEGYYHCRIKTITGIVNTDTVLILVKDNINTIQNHQQLFDLQVYPNPTSGLVYLKNTPGFKGDITVSIMDLMGKVLLNKPLHCIDPISDLTIDISSLDDGMYILMINTYQVKIVKKDNLK